MRIPDIATGMYVECLFTMDLIKPKVLQQILMILREL